jgi:diguanylate cyclase (GGDEF)-like protein/PAS domain S-box-containing protein/putative nucleotidyltransferase with HDIG domain
MKRLFRISALTALVALPSLLLIFEGYYADLHAVILQFFIFVIFVVAIWYRPWLFPVVVFYGTLHLVLDLIATQAFPFIALRETAMQFGIAVFLQFVLSSRDHSRDRLENYIAASRIATWEWDLKKNRMTYNERWAGMLGYTLEELKPIDTDTWKRLAHPDDVGGSAVLVAKVLAGELDYYDFIARLRHKEGRWIWIQDRGKIVRRDRRGRPLLMSGTHTDITRIHEAEEKIRSSQKLMQYIIEHSNSAIAVHDRDLKYLYVSDNYLKQYRVQDHDVIGKHHYDVFPDLPQKWRDVHQRTLRGEIITGDRDPYERTDGTVEYTRWESRPWYEDDGTIGGIIIYTEVITERVLMERELQRRADELYIQKQQADATLLSIGDGVVATGKDGRIVAFNRIAETLTGRYAAEVIGKSLEDVVVLVDEKSHTRLVDPAKTVMEDVGHSRHESHGVLVSTDGREFIVEETAAPIITAEGRFIGVVLVFRDVTEKHVRQREIEYLSEHDFLTGLYNRRHFVERMAELDIPTNHPLGLVMADYNGLKIINDAFGHDVGDEALKRIAEAFRETFRRQDVIARIGGDEYAVLLPNATADVIEELDGILRRAVSRETVNNVQLSIAIGYALKNGAGGSMDEVMKQAENDMYAHKISEGSSVRNKAIQAILGTLTDKYAKEKVHSERVSRICGAIGRALNLRAAELRELEMAGLYHDIGKIAIPDVILNKPGRLTPEEFEVMKKHTEVGYQILRAADEYSDLAESALSHQERWDGTGYPRGLSGTAIPLIPRIISVADAYEAMTSDRSYRRKLTRDEALEQLRLGKGTQFDPDLVDTFLAIVTDDL